jgi:hypothetical protein
METGKPEDRAASQEALRKWQEDPDLAGIRDAVPMAQLPAKDRDLFDKLWADVAALLR